MTSKPTSCARCPQPLRIEWLDDTGPLPVIFFRQQPAPVRICGAAARLASHGRGTFPRAFRALRPRLKTGRRHSSAAFTLLELLAVLAIIGLIAGMTLPHLRGFTKSNGMSAATRQMLDDVSYARQRAIANRSTVYMVFAPSAPWNYINFSTLPAQATHTFTNVVNSQYRGYALLTTRSVGDQPGRPHASYLTDWKRLPDGVMFVTNQFIGYSGGPSNYYYIYTTNTLSAPNSPHQFTVVPFSINYNFALPFPTIAFATNRLPYIAFSPNGSLVDENGSPVPDQFIALTSGSVLYPYGDDGAPLLYQSPLVAENPPGEWSNNPVLIHIDSTTARATVERNQF